MLAGTHHGISVTQIYRAADNPLMDHMVARFRGNQGEFIPKDAVAARLSRPPANGRWNGLFAWDKGCGGRHAREIEADG